MPQEQDQAAMLMQLMQPGATPPDQAPAPGVNMQDPGAPVDWDALTRDLQLAPEEVQILQIPRPGGGPSLGERIQALRPNVGGFQMGVDGNQITANRKF